MRIFFALMIFSLSLFAAESIGKAVSVEGRVVAMSGNVERILSEGSDVFLKEVISVALNARAQIQFTDGGIINLIPDTRFRVNSYKHKKIFQKDRFSSELLKGGFRTLSGEIARKNPNEYEVKTPAATIGLRGTIVEAVIQPNGLFVGVEHGRALVKNAVDSVMIGVGESSQFAFVESQNTAPEIRTQRPIELERAIFNPPVGGLPLDQIQQQRELAAPVETAPTEAVPTEEATPAQPPTEEGPSIIETPDEDFQLIPGGGGASIQGGC